MKWLAPLLFAACLLFAFPSCNNSSTAELHVFIWSDYIKRELIEKFEQKYNCKVVIDTYDSNESMYAKLKLGASHYDIIFPSNYYLDVMLRQDMLQQINPAAIPNLKNLDPYYMKLIGLSTFENGIPYMISNSGLAYRSDKVKDFEASWGIFSRSDLKGRMTMLNDAREALGAALKYLGLSINTTNPADIGKAADLLIKWKKNLAKFESEQYKNGIASAEFLVVQGYDGDILQVETENKQVAFAYPKEGPIMSVDFAAIPKDAVNLELAHLFLNYLLEPEVAAENIAFTHFLSPNVAAYEKLPPELRNNPTLFPSEEVLKSSEMIRNLDIEGMQYNRAWDRVKAAD